VTVAVVATAGETALTYSAAAGNDVGVELIVRSFRRLGLDVDHVTKSGRTALLIAVSRGHVECAAILAADGRADARIRDPVTGLTADQLAVTCTGYPLKRPPPPPPQPPDSKTGAGGRFGGRRGGGGSRAAAASAGRRGEGGDGGEETGGPARTCEKALDAAESFRRRAPASTDGRPRRRSSLPSSMKVRFEDAPTDTATTTTDHGGGLSREPTTTTTVDDDELSG